MHSSVIRELFSLRDVPFDSEHDSLISALNSSGLTYSSPDYIGLHSTMKLLSAFMSKMKRRDITERKLALQCLIDFCNQWFLSQDERAWTSICNQWIPVIGSRGILFLSIRSSASLSQEQQASGMFYALEREQVETQSNHLRHLLDIVFGEAQCQGSGWEHTGFVLTADNLLKLCLMRSFVLADIPVIMMGETGCGKTFLVQFFAKVMGFSKAATLDMHGGTTEEVIIKFLDQAKAGSVQKGKPSKTSTDRVLVFLDELNTSPASQLVKEIVCDGSCRGRPLERVVVLAACNPYRKRSSEAIRNQFALPLPDNRNLVYQV